MAEEIQDMILAEDLVKIYKTSDLEVLALQGLDLSVKKGELMAIIGNSGSGKSTFLNMLGGLDRPSAGKLYVDGKNLFTMTEKQLVDYKKNTVGFVWQNNARNLLPYLTATENVMTPMMLKGAGKRKERALELLDLVGLSHRKNSKLSELSGGEQQRVAIAIALANNPKLLLADEPTGSVDRKSADYILELFRKLNKTTDLTIVIVTHDTGLAKNVERVVSIKDGRTSSERIMKKDFSDAIRAEEMGKIWNSSAASFDDTQDEYAIVDKVGRVQIPRDLLDKIGVKHGTDRVKIEYEEGGRIILTGTSPVSVGGEASKEDVESDDKMNSNDKIDSKGKKDSKKETGARVGAEAEKSHRSGRKRKSVSIKSLENNTEEGDYGDEEY